MQQPQDLFWEGQAVEENPLPSQEAEKICKPVQDRNKYFLKHQWISVKLKTQSKSEIKYLLHMMANRKLTFCGITSN